MSSSHHCPPILLDSKFNSVRVTIYDGEFLQPWATHTSNRATYCRVDVGPETLYSEVTKDTVPARYYTEMCFPYHGSTTISFRVYDTKNREIGHGHVLCQKIFKKGGTGRKTLSLLSSNDVAGTLNLKVDFHPAALKEASARPYTAPAKASSSSSSSSSSSTSHGRSKVTKAKTHKGVKMTVIKGEKLHDPEMIGKMDPYVVARVGDKSVKGKCMSNAGSDPTFDQIFYMPWGDEKRMKVMVYDRQRLTSDRLVGVYKVDLEEVKPGTYKIPMQGPKKTDGGHLIVKMDFLNEAPTARYESVAKAAASASPSKETEQQGGAAKSSSSSSSSSSTSHGKSKLTQGIVNKGLKVTALNGVGLPDPETVGKMDPYVQLRVGDNLLKGKVARNQGSNPDFNQEFFMPWSGERTLKMVVYDRQVLSWDRPIGAGKVDLEHVEQNPGLYKLPLRDPKGESAGYINVKLSALKDAPTKMRCEQLDEEQAEASKLADKVTIPHENCTLNVFVHNGRDLQDVEFFGKMDPYCMLTLGNTTLSSSVNKSAGCNPKFNDFFQMQYRSERFLYLSVWDDESMTKDKVVGRAKYDLTPILKDKTNLLRQKIALRGANPNTPGGHLTVSFMFSTVAIDESRVTKTEESASFAARVKTPRTEAADGVNAGKSGSSSSSSSPSSSSSASKDASLAKGVQVTVHKCKGLQSAGILSTLDPYVKLKLGKLILRSDIKPNSSSDALIGTTFIAPYLGHRVAKIEVYDSQMLTSDRLIGVAKVELWPFAKSEGPQNALITISNKQQEITGTVETSIGFLHHNILKPSVFAEKADNIEVASSTSSSSSD